MEINEKLIKDCIAMNQIAQKQLYELLLPYLRAVANRYLKDTSFEQDVLQESFIKIFKNLDKYDSVKAPIKSWSARITINSCLNINKRVIGKVNEEFIAEKHQSHTHLEFENWTDSELLILIKRMPNALFEVFNLYAIDGYTHSEIAEILRIKEAVSRKRMSRSRAWLKETLLENTDVLPNINLKLLFNT